MRKWIDRVRRWSAIVIAVCILWAWFSGEGMFCPDCPDPVVDNFEVDHRAYSIAQLICADSIAALQHGEG